MVRAGTLPEQRQFVEGLQPPGGAGCKKGGIDRTRRRAHQHLEGKPGCPATLRPHDLRQRLQHTRLVRGARTAPHEHQTQRTGTGAAQAGLDDGVKTHGGMKVA